MNNEEKLKKYIEDNNGIVLTSDLKDIKIHKQYLKILCDKKYIVKIGKGVYVRKDKSINEFFLLQQKYKTSIFSHSTALYFYHLTDRTPIKLDLTFKSNVRVNDELVNCHYVKDENFRLGEVTIKLQDKTSIRIYDLERTIVDIIRDRNKIDTQIFSTAIREYAKSKYKNLVRLSEYAKAFKVENLVKQYMGVLL